MTVDFTVVLTAIILIACGIYLMLERTLTRIVIGFVLAGNGVNLLFVIAAGPPGRPAFYDPQSADHTSDPLPFAMVLTAIVITMGLTAFGVALAHRAWQLFGHDEVQDDVEDRRVARRLRRLRRAAHRAISAQPTRQSSRATAAPSDTGSADSPSPLGIEGSSAKTPLDADPQMSPDRGDGPSPRGDTADRHGDPERTNRPDKTDSIKGEAGREPDTPDSESTRTDTTSDTTDEDHDGCETGADRPEIEPDSADEDADGTDSDDDLGEEIGIDLYSDDDVVQDPTESDETPEDEQEVGR
ncbi:Na(+)/H(+) antiporter subunit C [Devriesea agamarum]|uniref:Na(+)/H(+) antiporter subunit C n=1 Tax=Devriesea agamarum TaxID=472569 RepID=UPI000A058CF6|nr:Na(+)/H(+) antiporter subunit C [Devriesea agamarum]